jgi:lipopolysaccharide/colanic/teichoic acid biosynthesis glycosyltransferase
MKSFLPKSAPVGDGDSKFRTLPEPDLLDIECALPRQPAVRPHFAVTPEARASSRRAKPDHSRTNPTPAMIAVCRPFPLWKRALDLAGCVVALPLLALCTLVMAGIMRCVSPGPVFFRQERIGHGGRRFKIYKFRTMRVGSDSSVHQSYYKELIGTNAPMVKLDSRGDSRLIPGAWLLRAAGLDELPQLINVLRGEMSLVGPRPCIPSEFDQYLPWQRRRCEVLPGLTGLWQVSGKNRTTFEQMIRFDIKYAQRLSLCLDLKIILLTVPSLLAQIRDTRRACPLPGPADRISSPVVSFRASSDSRSP